MSALRFVRREKRVIRRCAGCSKAGGHYHMEIRDRVLTDRDGRVEWWCGSCAAGLRRVWDSAREAA